MSESKLYLGTPNKGRFFSRWEKKSICDKQWFEKIEAMDEVHKEGLNPNNLFEIWSFQSAEHLGCGILGYAIV